jgi:hypothetical protein
LKARIVGTDSTEDVEPRASGHFKVENHRVWAQLPDGADRLRHIPCSPYKLNTRYVPEQVGESLGDYR